MAELAEAIHSVEVLQVLNELNINKLRQQVSDLENDFHDKPRVDLGLQTSILDNCMCPFCLCRRTNHFAKTCIKCRYGGVPFLCFPATPNPLPY